jgi:hypothetical protein
VKNGISLPFPVAEPALVKLNDVEAQLSMDAKNSMDTRQEDLPARIPFVSTNYEMKIPPSVLDKLGLNVFSVKRFVDKNANKVQPEDFPSPLQSAFALDKLAENLSGKAAVSRIASAADRLAGWMVRRHTVALKYDGAPAYTMNAKNEAEPIAVKEEAIPEEEQVVTVATSRQRRKQKAADVARPSVRNPLPDTAKVKIAGLKKKTVTVQPDSEESGAGTAPSQNLRNGVGSQEGGVPQSVRQPMGQMPKDSVSRQKRQRRKISASSSAMASLPRVAKAARGQNVPKKVKEPRTKATAQKRIVAKPEKMGSWRRRQGIVDRLALAGVQIEAFVEQLKNNGWEPVARDFVGRGALERERAAGPEAKLAGLVLGERGVMRRGQRVVTAAGAGEVTSGGFSPTMGCSIALARVPSAADGECQVDIRGALRPARLVRPPFVRHGRVLV